LQIEIIRGGTGRNYSSVIDGENDIDQDPIFHNMFMSSNSNVGMFFWFYGVF